MTRFIAPGSGQVTLSIAVILFLFIAFPYSEPVGALDNEEVQRFRHQAEQGDAESQFRLGVMYDQGLGVPQSYAEAVKWWRQAAEQGHAKAQFRLGSMYQIGLSVPQDDVEAVKWYQRAAERGNVIAQHRLGWMYWAGRGVAQSYTEAVKWYRWGAEQGYAWAQRALGSMYEDGHGVPQDHVEAYKWYNLAASRLSSDDPDLLDAARKWPDKVAKRMTREEVATAQRLAREWQPKTWDQLKAE